MQLAFHHPAPPLSQHVELFTYYENRSEVHLIERLLPDGSVNLIIDLTDIPKYLFDNTTLVANQQCKKAWISGMHSRFISISAAQESSMFVIRFRPGGSYPFLKLPLHELNNLVIDATILLGNDVLTFRQQLGEANSIPEKFIVAEHWLTTIAQYDHAGGAIISFAVSALSDASSSQALYDIAIRSGYSQKQFIHIFKTHLGVSPKIFQRIMRFNRVLDEIGKRQSIQWTRLSLDLGYFDQAHFIREFQEFSGFNPKAFLRERGEYIHYVPVK